MKSKKALRLGVLVLSLGALVGCGETETGNGGGGEPDKPHVCEADKDAGLQSNSTKHWYKCKDADCKLHVEEAAHDLGEAQKTKDPTCTVAGSQKQICKVCNYEKVSAIPATGHKYEQVEGADKVVWEREANCTETGIGTKTCTVCNETEDVTAEALGHVYEQVEGADKVIWTQNQDCTHAGIGTKTCTRCEAVEDVNVDALGHALKLIDPKTPEAGEAAVNLYECQREGCTEKYLGFQANEASTASLERLDIDDDGGARFKGRPIGNAISLPQADGGDHTPVWDKTETGDFFEYKFKLTADQVETLNGGTCRIYCEAVAAQWMSENSLDFWACKEGITEWDPQSEWTPGMYIDDAHPGVHVDGDNPNTEADETETGYMQGQFILDYRYILYVDGQPVEFDKNIKNPVKSGANNEKRTYVLPYTFDLHEGLNTISLRMAGGYLSTFYSFTFRPVDPEAESAWVNAGDKFADVQPVKNAWVEKAYMLDAADCVGQNAPVAGTDNASKNTRLGKNSVKENVWEINGLESGQYNVYVKGAYSAGNGTSYWSADQNMTINHDQAGNNGGGDGMTGPHYFFKVDDLDAIPAASEKTYAETGLSEADAGSWTKVPMANIGVADGATTLKMTTPGNGYSIWVFAIRLERTGKYIKPAMGITFADGKAKVEAESFTDSSAAVTPEVEDEATILKEVGGWPAFSAEYRINFTEAKRVKLVLRYKWVSAQWGNYGAAELYLDNGAKIPNVGGNDNSNIGEAEEGPTSEWMTAESSVFDIAAGIHTIKLQTPGGCKVSWDYFELVEVAAE